MGVSVFLTLVEYCDWSTQISEFGLSLVDTISLCTIQVPEEWQLIIYEWQLIIYEWQIIIYEWQLIIHEWHLIIRNGMAPGSFVKVYRDI